MTTVVAAAADSAHNSVVFYDYGMSEMDSVVFYDYGMSEMDSVVLHHRHIVVVVGCDKFVALNIYFCEYFFIVGRQKEIQTQNKNEHQQQSPRKLHHSG